MMSEESRPKARQIVIIGGGVIGCCTAYYLTRHKLFDPLRDSITILESSKIAAAASGKAGGLLALWAYPSCIVKLSFQLHADLAAEHDGPKRWGYRRIHCARVGVRGQQLENKSTSGDNVTGSGSMRHLQMPVTRGHNVLPDVPDDLDWLYLENVNSYRPVGSPVDTAQVTPFEFTTEMADLALQKGATLVLGQALNIDKDGSRVVSVTFRPKGTDAIEKLPATDVVLCAGPWARDLHPPTSTIGLCQNSVVMQPARPLSAYMLFSEISLATSNAQRSQHVAPEIFARPNDTVWAAGEPDPDVALPPTADQVSADSEICQSIVGHVSSISPELGNGRVLVEQRCFLPNIEGNVPGPLLGGTEIKGLWVAAGHSCWGIQNAPGTGKIMSEFVYDGKATSADVEELDIRLVPTTTAAE